MNIHGEAETPEEWKWRQDRIKANREAIAAEKAKAYSKQEAQKMRHRRKMRDKAGRKH